jgi:hypothetical protein
MMGPIQIWELEKFFENNSFRKKFFLSPKESLMSNSPPPFNSMEGGPFQKSERPWIPY